MGLSEKQKERGERQRKGEGDGRGAQREKPLHSDNQTVQATERESRRAAASRSPRIWAGGWGVVPEARSRTSAPHHLEPTVRGHCAHAGWGAVERKKRRPGPEGGRASRRGILAEGCEAKGAPPGTYAAAFSGGFRRAGGRARSRRRRRPLARPASRPRPPRSPSPRPQAQTRCSPGAAATPAVALRGRLAPAPGPTRRRRERRWMRRWRPCRGAPWARRTGPIPSAAATAASRASPPAPSDKNLLRGGPARAQAHPRPAASSGAPTRSEPIQAT